MKLLNNDQAPASTPSTNNNDLSSLQSSLMEEGTTSSSVADTTSAPDEQSIIQKLLQDKQANEKRSHKSDSLNQGQKRSLSASEVATMRYKFLTIVFIVLAIVLWTSFVHPALNDYMKNRQTLADAKAITTQSTTDIKEAQLLYDFAEAVEDEGAALTTCVNSDSDCDDEVTSLIPYVQEKESARKQAQYYLQIGDLSDPKLLVDERSILTNIDLFLLRFGPDNTPQRTNIGDITSIIISDPLVVQGKMYSVDIELSINFPNNESLINFLNNAENRIISNETIDLSPILYKVQEVGYDITKYDESQDTTIKLTAYYYKDDAVAESE